MSEKTITVDDLYRLLGRGSMRSSIRSMLQPITRPFIENTREYIEGTICASMRISGHFDSFISKCSSHVLAKYLWPRYGESIWMDVDKNFAMCTASMEKVKKSALAFPEVINKTIHPGVYVVKLDDYKDIMVVIKESILGNGDVSTNGIRSDVTSFQTTVLIFGPKKRTWKEHIQSQIDILCSALVKRTSHSTAIKVTEMTGTGSGDGAMGSDVETRPMEFLTFPEKQKILDEIDTFKRSASAYAEAGVPHRLGFLFYGPHGTGKTTMAYSIAKFFDMECVSVDLSYFDKSSGMGAFNGKDTVYIIDEIDSHLRNRTNDEEYHGSTEDVHGTTRLVKLLKAMDQMSNGSIVIATTNYEDRLDPALRRSGRFDYEHEFDHLDMEYARKMVEARGLDPDKVIQGFETPIKPAELEVAIINAIARKANAGSKERVELTELLGEDIVNKAAEEEQKIAEDQAKAMEEANAAAVADPQGEDDEDDEDDDD